MSIKMNFKLKLIFISFLIHILLNDRIIASNANSNRLSENECKPYIAKALRELNNSENSNLEEDKLNEVNGTDDNIKLNDTNEKLQFKRNDQTKQNEIENINNDIVVEVIDIDDSFKQNEDDKKNEVIDQLLNNKNKIIINKNEENISNNNDQFVINDENQTDKQKEILNIDDNLDKRKKDLNEEDNEYKQFDEQNNNQDQSENDLKYMDMNIQMKEIRSRHQINKILHLNEKDKSEIDFGMKIENMNKIILRDLKRLYEHAIKPLETLYKYRDLSNRYFGDAELFSKPLIIFMGPWSGGKSTIINYLLENKYDISLKTGAEPSPAYFHILMWNNETEILDGTQLAADPIFSGLQKFGQGLEEKLKGYKLNNKLLEKINIVEIPGILELSKLITRSFHFNDVCQWFIDRADLIYLVYDPMKIDVGPEIATILDQLKGRENHVRILFNKADQLTHDEILKMQNSLIWNISPVMSSAQPPIMYITSLWQYAFKNHDLENFLEEQEIEFLKDLQNTIEKKIENKIANARRFAIRVRNHAKMVDCYLTTYYNHKTFFGNRKIISDAIVQNPQNYHIYEGLSTLTNVSRYDLPDPDMYRNFFNLNPLFDFQKLSDTCTYFKGCPINKLDIAIAYDLPELVNRYKKNLQIIKQGVIN